MNTKMWTDLTTALMQRLNSSYTATGTQIMTGSVDDDPAVGLKRVAKQMETDMGRYQAIFRHIQNDRFEQAYNLLDEVGKQPEDVTPVEPVPETPTVGG